MAGFIVLQLGVGGGNGSRLKSQAILIEKLRYQLAGQRAHRFGSSSESIEQLQPALETSEIAVAKMTAKLRLPDEAPSRDRHPILQTPTIGMIDESRLQLDDARGYHAAGYLLLCRIERRAPGVAPDEGAFVDHILRQLPQIQSILVQPAISAIAERHGHSATVAALRDLLEGMRRDILAGNALSLPEFSGDGFAQMLLSTIEEAQAASLRGVINATGVIIHTNLGRAPLSQQAIAAMSHMGSTASNLEFDLKTGKRGSRHAHVEALICTLAGAEAAVVVNNCAAAVLLSLMVTAAGRNVVASRGELIEIGGSYRLPDVITQSGATLREVGTTNRTRLDDYAEAIDEGTSVLLKSHTSNFKIIGFTSAPERHELAALAQRENLILMEDLGSGVLVDLSPYGMGDEPVVADILKAGVDLVMFSGDKLLGGPQAGIIAGCRDIIDRLKASPLMRAVRIDKLSLAALEATLRLYCPPFDPFKEIPVLRMLSEPLEAVEARAQALAGALGAVAGLDVQVEQTTARAGAGALPEHDLLSAAVTLGSAGMSADALAGALRANAPPVIGRIERDRVFLDMRTVSDADLPKIAAALNQIARVR